MARKRQKVLPLRWVSANITDDTTTQSAPPIRIRHTELNLDAGGSSSGRISYISAPASPQKRLTPTPVPDYDWNEEPAPLEINEENYPFLDPAYQLFTDGNIYDEGLPPPRRKRNTQVCGL